MEPLPVSHFINKLDLLKEYMALRIDGGGKILEICLDDISPSLSVENIVNIFRQTGLLIYSDTTYAPPKELTFDEYITTKQTLK